MSEIEGTLNQRIREFAGQYRNGWYHSDWEGFLESLRQEGYDTSNEAEIGERAERERLSLLLGEIKGVNERTAKALVERFGSVWNFRTANEEEVLSASPSKQAGRTAYQAIRGE